MALPLFACSIVAGWALQVQGNGPRALPVASPTESQAAVELGPISTRNGRVVCLPFLRFVPRADFLKAGSRSIETSIQVINDVRRDPKDVNRPSTLEEDQETQRFAFVFSQGLAHNLEASVEIPILFRDGGFMDPIISWWHKTILGPQDRVRDHLPYGRSFVRIPGVGDFGSAGGVGDVSLFLRKRISPRVIIAAAAKVPTGDARQLLGSGAFDAGLNVEYRTMLGRHFRLDASAGFVAQGKPTVLKKARGLVDQEFVALTYLKNSRDAWIAQWQSEASPILTVPMADGAHRMLTFGYERRLSRAERLDLYFSEDADLVPGAPMLVNIAPDFTIGVRFVRRF